MYFNVSQLLKEHGGSTRSYTLDESFTPLEETSVSYVRGTADLMRTDKGIWVNAKLDAEAVCVCSLCLERYMQSIHMEIEEEFFPSFERRGLAATGESLGPEESFNIDVNNILDLTEAIRQYSTLSVPMKPMCRDDCAGLCASCGANLNQAACHCDKTQRDPKWDALLEMVPASEAIDRRAE